MRYPFVIAAIALLAVPAFAEVKTRKIQYKAGDKEMVGFLAWDDSTDTKRPAVMVIPEWWGNNAYAHQRATQIAQLGYVGFAIDMYGDEKTTDDPKQAGEWAGEVKKSPHLATERTRAALANADGSSRRQTALAEATYGRGKIILFAFRPQHRGQSWTTFPFIFNALDAQ